MRIFCENLKNLCLAFGFLTQVAPGRCVSAQKYYPNVFFIFLVGCDAPSELWAEDQSHQLRRNLPKTSEKQR